MPSSLNHYQPVCHCSVLCTINQQLTYFDTEIRILVFMYLINRHSLISGTVCCSSIRVATYTARHDGNRLCTS